MIDSSIIASIIIGFIAITNHSFHQIIDEGFKKHIKTYISYISILFIFGITMHYCGALPKSTNLVTICIAQGFFIILNGVAHILTLKKSKGLFLHVILTMACIISIGIVYIVAEPLIKSVPQQTQDLPLYISLNKFNLS